MLDSLLVKEILDAPVLEAYFIQAMYWSLGATLIEESREKFDNYIKYCTSFPAASEGNDAKVGEVPGILHTLKSEFNSHITVHYIL